MTSHTITLENQATLTRIKPTEEEIIELSGAILINKPKGISSFSAVYKVKHALRKIVKVGHTGTLDPFAEGLLILLLGKATKKWQDFQKFEKVYQAEIEFGYETDTQDPTGEIINSNSNVISRKEFENAISDWPKQYMQLPPNYSAKRVNGQRAYQLAVRKQEFTLQPKEVTIHYIKLLDFDWPKANIEISVSSGTYIRTLALDIAKKLGSYATVINLKRISIGEFNVNDALDPENIDMELIKNNLRKI